MSIRDWLASQKWIPGLQLTVSTAADIKTDLVDKGVLTESEVIIVS